MNEKDYDFIKEEYINNMKVGDVLHYFDTIFDMAKEDLIDSKKDIILALTAAKCEFLCECMYKKRHGNSYKEWLDKRMATNELKEQMEKVKVVATYTEPPKNSTKETPTSFEEEVANNHGFIFAPLAREKELWDCIRQFCKYRDENYNRPVSSCIFFKGRTSLHITFTRERKCYVEVEHFGNVVYKYEFNADCSIENFLGFYSRRITKHLGAYARKLGKMTSAI